MYPLPNPLKAKSSASNTRINFFLYSSNEEEMTFISPSLVPQQFLILNIQFTSYLNPSLSRGWLLPPLSCCSISLVLATVTAMASGYSYNYDFDKWSDWLIIFWTKFIYHSHWKENFDITVLLRHRIFSCFYIHFVTNKLEPLCDFITDFWVRWNY